MGELSLRNDAKVINFNEQAQFKGKVLKGEGFDITDAKEEKDMPKEKLVYEKDLKNLEEKIDLKLENIETNLSCEISNMKTEINSNLGLLKSEIEIMIINKSVQEEKARKKENRETIRTILTGVSAIAAFTGLLLKIFLGL